MRNLYIGDFETSTGKDNGETFVGLWALSDTTKEKRYRGVDMNGFMRTIDILAIKNIYFHNLSWDGEFIKHWLLENGYEFVDGDNKTKLLEGQFKWLEDDRGTLYSMDINTHMSTKIHFGDTAKLLMSSVDRLGDKLGMAKLKVDYDSLVKWDKWEDVPKHWRDYVFRDVDIVIDVYNEFSKHYKNHSITLAGTAMKDFKKHYGQHQHAKDFGGQFRTRTKGMLTYNVLTRDKWEELRQGYKGGYTVGNEKLRGKELKVDGYSYDIHSSFPAIMMNRFLPYGEPLRYKPEGRYVSLHKLFVYSMTKLDVLMPAHMHRPGAGLMSKVKYIDEGENFYCTYTDEELKELEKTYDMDYIIINTTYFKAKKIFTTWVEGKSFLKINALNEIERLYHKTIQNSLYGKYGEHPDKGGRVVIKDTSGIKPGRRYGENNEYVEQKIVDTMENLSYIPLAIFITSYARIELLKVIRANKDTFMYCDTDSVYLSAEGKGINIHKNKYGYWGPELRFSRFKWVKPKAYIADKTHSYQKGEWVKETGIKRAIAGLTKEYQSTVNFENFHSGSVILKGKRQKKAVKGGFILVDTNYTV